MYNYVEFGEVIDIQTLQSMSHCTKWSLNNLEAYRGKETVRAAAAVVHGIPKSTFSP